MEPPAVNSPVFNHKLRNHKILKWNFQDEFSMSAGAFTLESTRIYSSTWLLKL